MSTGFRYSFNWKFLAFSNNIAEVLRGKIEFASYYDDAQGQFEYWINGK